LWSGLDPEELAAVHAEQSAAVASTDEGRSEALAAEDPFAAVQQIHRQIHRAQLDYQDAAEERRQLAVDVGEFTRELVEVLTSVGWSEQQARKVDVLQLSRRGGET